MSGELYFIVSSILLAFLKTGFLLIIVSIVSSIILHVIISLAEKIVKIPVNPIIDSIAFPGLILRQTMLRLTASFLGYRPRNSFFYRSGEANVNLLFDRPLTNPLHLFLISFSPYLNLLVAYVLLATQSWVIAFLPSSMTMAYKIMVIYIVISIIVSGQPNAKDVLFFFNSVIQVAPWFFFLTMWGVIAAAFMNEILGTTSALLFLSFYEAFLLYLELRESSFPAKAIPKPRRTPKKQWNYYYDPRKHRGLTITIIEENEND